VLFSYQIPIMPSIVDSYHTPVPALVERHKIARTPTGNNRFFPPGWVEFWQKYWPLYQSRVEDSAEKAYSKLSKRTVRSSLFANIYKGTKSFSDYTPFLWIQPEEHIFVEKIRGREYHDATTREADQVLIFYQPIFAVKHNPSFGPYWLE